MKRSISLYISGRKVDLDDQSLILYNYTADDLSNPTIVKNSYTQQISLRGTANNNALFGAIYRVDRVLTYDGGISGTDFNPSVRNPFVIMDELGQVLESGYAKLDKIARNRNEVVYNITLYGGLGSFFYSLAYDDNGNKRSLADLDYLGTVNPEAEFDFTINAQAVRDAWEQICDEVPKSPKWDCINFAPAYNGIPDNFDANKGIVTPSDVGLQNEVTVDGKKYSVNRTGGSVVTFANKYDEWAVKDLRSYLQRPVFKMSALLEAICKPVNNGGFSVDIDALRETFQYRFLWMTLPMLSTLTAKQSDAGLSLTAATPSTSTGQLARFTIVGDVPSGVRVSSNLAFDLKILVPDVQIVRMSRYASVGKQYSMTGKAIKQTAMFIQALAYSATDELVGGSSVKVFYTSDPGAVTTGEDLAKVCNFRPTWALAGYEPIDSTSEFSRASATATPYLTFAKKLGFSVEASNVSYYIIKINSYLLTSYLTMGTYSTLSVQSTANQCPWVFQDYDHSQHVTSMQAETSAADNSVVMDATATLRSGAKITKRMLLSTEGTPADYLLGLCKMFGWYFIYDSAGKAVKIVPRNSLYIDKTIDISRRIDRSKEVAISPLAFSAKWYDFKLAGAGGAFYDEYTKNYGIPYGLQRVNTGYEFDANAVDLLDGVPYKNACTILDHGKYYNIISEGGQFRPSPFIDTGNTYALWANDGSTVQLDIPCPPTTADVEYYNDYGHPGYDIEFARKMEFRDASGKALTGDNVLVYSEGTNQYTRFKITDDTTAMDTYNNGKACWLIGSGTDEGVRLPIFGRYWYKREWNVDISLDFGVPKELDIPVTTYDPDSTLYARFWKKYMADRYDVNTKVVTCKVYLDGLQVGPELLRQFYWFDGSLWVMNAIRNYSLTTSDPAECEFIQVQDKDNYLNGQNLE